MTTIGFLLFIGSQICGGSGSQVSVTPGSPIQDQAAFEKSRVAIWKSALQDTFKPIAQNVLIDVNKAELPATPPRVVPPNARPDLGTNLPARTEDIIRLSAGFLHRNAVRMKDGWAFKRDLVHGNLFSSRYEAVFRWLKSADSHEIQAMLGPGVPYAYLSDGSKDLFARLCPNRGLQKKMANNEFASAELRVSFVGHYTNKDSAPAALVLDLGSRLWPSEEARRAKLLKSYVPPTIEPSQKGKPAEGTLDFSNGDILSIDDLCKQATATFGRPFTFDGRLGSSYCYIQGHFSIESFTNYMKTLCQTIEFELIKTEAEYRDELIRLISDIVAPQLDPSTAPQGMNFQAVLRGESIKGSDMFKSFPDLEQTMRQLQLRPETPFRLSPGLTLQLVGEGSDIDPLDPPGSSPLLNSWATTFGSVK